MPDDQPHSRRGRVRHWLRSASVGEVAQVVIACVGLLAAAAAVTAAWNSNQLSKRIEERQTEPRVRASPGPLVALRVSRAPGRRLLAKGSLVVTNSGGVSDAVSGVGMLLGQGQEALLDVETTPALPVEVPPGRAVVINTRAELPESEVSRMTRADRNALRGTDVTHLPVSAQVLFELSGAEEHSLELAIVH
jgi:hypothetical protein